jgi:hypothetical protein
MGAILCVSARQCTLKQHSLTREALIKSELPRHMDVPPFSMADKPLKMEKTENRFSVFVV